MKKFKLMQKLIIVAFMVIILTAFAIIATSAATYSGNCGAEGDGSNLTWTLDTETGALKIRGTGEMAYCGSLDVGCVAPWSSYRNDIKKVVIANGVTSIGYDAFRDCTSLKSVTIPDSVTSIGSYAFMDCGSLTSVTIPDSVTSIGDFAFRNCDSLTSIVVSSNNTAYCSIDGNLYTEDASVLIQYAIGKPDTSFIIPDSVTSIGDYAFDDCDNLKSVTIPDSVTSIGWRPFLGCGSLEYNVYDNAKYLGNEQNPYLYLAYSINDNITSCNIHDDTRLIGNSAFFCCNSLTSVTIPDSVTSIGYEAFAYCSKLTSVTVLSRNAEIAEIYDGMYTFPSSATIYGYAGSTAESYAEKYGREFVALHCVHGTHDWRYSGTNSECAICKEICADHTELGLDFKCAVCGKDTGATNSFNQGSSMVNDTYFTLEKHHNVKVSFDFTIGNAYYDNSTKPSVISDYHSLFTLIRNKNSGGAEYHVFASLWMDQESGKLYLTKAGSSATKICEIELGEKYSFSVNFKPKSSGAHTVTISKGGVVIGTLNANISSFSEDISAVQLRFGEGVDVKYLRVKDVSYENIEVTPEPYSNGVCTECGAECKHVYNAGGYCHICGMLGDPITFSDGQNGGGNIVDTVKNANPLTIRDGAYSQNNGSYKQCWDFRDTEGLLLGKDYVFESKFTFNEFIDNPNSENGATNLLIWSDSDIGSDYNKFLVMLYTDNGKLELGISTTQRTELKLGEEYDIRVVIRSDKRADNKYNNRAEIYVNGRFMWTKNFVLTAEDGMSIRIGDHVVRKSKVKYDVKNDFGIHFIDSGIDYIGLQEKEDANYNYDTKFDLRFVFGFDDLYLEDVGVKIKAESFGGRLYDESSSVKSLSSSRTVLEELLVDGKVCKPGINGVGYGGYYLALVVKDIALDPAATYVFTLTPYLNHHDDDNQTLMEKSHKITVIFVDNQMQIDYQEVTK